MLVKSFRMVNGSHANKNQTMWMIRPWVAPREITIDLPAVIVESLGSGAEVLASYLTTLAEAGIEDPAHHAPPLPVLCRICERHIPPWWFEKHTELCLQEHKAEMEVQLCHENLIEHRHAIVKVLDALEARNSRSQGGESTTPPPPHAEYKGMNIGPTSSPASSGTLSPGTPSRSLERSASGFGHARGRSFAVRRPQARIVELLLDLVDTAIEINTPVIKENVSQGPGEFRTQSPQSESRLAQVMQWQSPSTHTVDQEQGLAVLCADTEGAAKAKAEAVIRHRRIIEYSERIRMEFSIIVQDCIDEAVAKAARLTAGEVSDSSGEGETAAQDDGFFSGSFENPSSLAVALREQELAMTAQERRRLSSAAVSTRSNSPKECPTPRSHAGTLSMLGQSSNSLRESLFFESDNGDVSDGSIRSSSVASRPGRTDSPISEFGDLRRAASSRQRHRRSIQLLPGNSSPHRQESPSRLALAQPSSPLRITKPRALPTNHEGIISPIASPLLPTTTEFSSPVLAAPRHRRQSSATASDMMRPPLSPRLTTASAPQARAVPPSIKDFEIIKPISKGAFGSVYLSKKKSTGEYFAIKVLKKADMVAKNQVTNVKAERAIMMWQGESDFVAKLYWTFSSKDYLYLVMEYLNGGDCASLIKILGGLPEDWAKRYLGEVILGVEHLHNRGIIHRDLKPDNLLIDQKGHLKLTDFGLSRMGLIGRQKRVLNSASTDTAPDLLREPFSQRSVSMTSSRSTSFDFHGHHSPGTTPQMTPDLAGTLGQPSYFNLSKESNQNKGPSRRTSGGRSDSGGSDSLLKMFTGCSLNESQNQGNPGRMTIEEMSENGGGDSPEILLHQNASNGTHDLSRSTPPNTSMMPPPPMALFDPGDSNRKFVGTPDYLAPETVNGLGQDEKSDWWSVGCILFEFLYGYPPFHADTPDKVFENILARRISWPDEDDFEVSEEAKDIMNKLLCIDPQQRLGANSKEKLASGGEEIRNHPWFEGTNWDCLLEDEAQFVPAPENPEDTEYFDTRGATLQSFAEEMEDQMSPQVSTPGADYPERPHDALSRVRTQVNSMKRGLMPLHIPPHVRDTKSNRRLSEPVVADDFGNFSFKNLPVLEKANKDVIQKLRAEALAAQSKQVVSTPGTPSSVTSPMIPLEGSPVLPMPIQRSISSAKGGTRPSSPSISNASPSRASQPSSPLLVSFVAGQHNDTRRKTSSNSSSLSHQSGTSLQPGSFFDVPRTAASLQKPSTLSSSSPIKGRGIPPPLSMSPQMIIPQRTTSGGNPTHNPTTRARSQTVGSQDGSPGTPDMFSHHRQRRSQVFDMSPSSSDNENDKANALLRVQRRRQSSRRMSAITLADGPMFRPLDVLICEDHPVSRMVMEKLLEKLRCRTITVANGAEAMRCAMSEIKFDIIMMEFKLPQINGADVARMIRDTKNANSQTPIVAITGYLKELQMPHHFDALIEKPPTTSKLTDVMCRLCQWRAPSPGQNLPVPLSYPMPSGLRQSTRHEDSPTSTSSGSANMPGSSLHGSSREDSISSSMFGDTESMMTEDVPVIISRQPTNEWPDLSAGLNNEEAVLDSCDLPKTPARLLQQSSAPAQIQITKTPSRQRSSEKMQAKRASMDKRRAQAVEEAESGDDEDEELGDSSVRDRDRSPRSAAASKAQRGSKLGTEMMRTNSRGSVVSGSEHTIYTDPVPMPPTVAEDMPLAADLNALTLTPPEIFTSPGDKVAEIDMDRTPKPPAPRAGSDEEATPRTGVVAARPTKGTFGTSPTPAR